MRREVLSFTADPIRNVHISGDMKVLQLSLAKGKSIARRRIPDEATIVVVSGSIGVEAGRTQTALSSRSIIYGIPERGRHLLPIAGRLLRPEEKSDYQQQWEVELDEVSVEVS